MEFGEEYKSYQRKVPVFVPRWIKFPTEELKSGGCGLINTHPPRRSRSSPFL